MRGVGAPLLLASVRDVDEAVFALNGGADLIDAKDPAKGALGALSVLVVSDIVRVVDGAVPVSATVGDVPSNADAVVDAMLPVSASGVDIVKVGFVPGPGTASAIAAAGEMMTTRAPRGQKCVAVFFADLGFDPLWIAASARAGLFGVMVDTSGKRDGSLIDHLGLAPIAAFVSTAHQHGLIAGVAGSLGLHAAETLCAAEPDIMGFRGGLCRDGDRRQPLDAGALEALRRALDRQVPAMPATVAGGL